jgi:predicted acyl esterase
VKQPTREASGEHRFQRDRNVRVPMRDGVELAADIWVPAGVERAPVLLQPDALWPDNHGADDAADGVGRGGREHLTAPDSDADAKTDLGRGGD